MNHAVKKVVIPVAGLGTRMLPATKAIPKEMLPLVDKPLIQYIVNECVSAGLTEIVLVTHASKNAIENHFDTSFELEVTLEKRVKRQLLAEVQNICPPGVTVISVRQGEAKGLGHAIHCARPIIGDEPFAVVLPDVIIDQYSCRLSDDNLAAMVQRFNTSGVSQIMVEPVAEEDVSIYGIADCNGTQLHPSSIAPIYAIVEKPERDVAPSNLAIVGRYVFTSEIWPLLAKTPVGVGGEIQLTDAVGMLLEQHSVEAYHIEGCSHDCGDKLGYMKANMAYALRHPKMGAAMKDYCLEQTQAQQKPAHLKRA
ncbi:UTP--glucose-1-phosphate uridylyltransferase GalU [Paraferrimonas sedimenticola]|uniref:UTP--glucose-1-phosphate uridylyltransferase n=1 Tax=Paraferrimonas sedimenticola TaxID=375674 RepID=A0AA37RUU4_9GAMM|nr:UTP--glucose-1-phosphate uridylyltransferase GalU [Paraferrimonas sedimenticola]GLP95715.1 UTP--glucose-1-phosphate uridylyltransferase [Paraferrimonas sedimenticola]